MISARIRSQIIAIYIAIASSMNNVPFGYCSFMFGISFPEYMKHHFGILDTDTDFLKYQTIFNTLHGVGALAGNIIVGHLSIAIGRRYSIIIAGLIGTLSTAGLQIRSIPVVCISRFFVAFGIGMLFSQGLIFLRESLPIQERLNKSKWPGIFLNTGGLVANLLSFGFVFSSYYRIYFSIGTMIYILLTVLMLLLRHDTPLYLISKNKVSAAKKSIKFIYHKDDNEQALSEYTKIVSNNLNKQQGLKNIFNAQNKKRTIYGIILGFTQSSGGVALVLFFNYTFMRKASENSDGDVDLIKVALFSTFFGVLSFICSYISGKLAQKFGRKIVIICGGIIQIISLVLIGIFYQTKIYFLLPLPVYLFMVGFTHGFGTNLMILIPELCEAYAVDVAYIFYWIGYIPYLTFYGYIAKSIGPHYVFYGIAIYMVGILIFFIICIKETKGKTHENIIADYFKKIDNEVSSNKSELDTGRSTSTINTEENVSFKAELTQQYNVAPETK